MAKKDTLQISDLKFDENNANKGTVEGSALIRNSLEKAGLGRSIVIDKEGNVIAGNKTLEQAKELGYKEVTVIKTNGNEVVAVQREDLEITDERAIQLALFDNRAGEVSLQWDDEVLATIAESYDVTDIFDEEFLSQLENPNDFEPEDDGQRLDKGRAPKQCPHCGEDI